MSFGVDYGKHPTRMATPQQRLINGLKKQKAFAWAKVFETYREQNERDHRHYERLTHRTGDDVAIPQHIKDDLIAMATELKKKWECPVCMDFIPHDGIALTNCGHVYCKACLEQWVAREKELGKDKWKCCMCNRNHAFKEED
jgi:hypothetical protein